MQTFVEQLMRSMERFWSAWTDPSNNLFKQHQEQENELFEGDAQYHEIFGGFSAPRLFSKMEASSSDTSIATPSPIDAI